MYEQIVQVRPWDARARLRLALKCLRFADITEAETHLQQILSMPAKSTGAVRTGARAPLPLTDARVSRSKTPTSDIASLLDFAPGFEREDLDKLRGFLSQPRPEFGELPEDPALVRLRAVEELTQLRRRKGGAALQAWIRQWSTGKVDEVERLWALYYAGEGDAFRKRLRVALMADANGIEGQFCLIWLTLRSHGMKDAFSTGSQNHQPPQPSS